MVLKLNIKDFIVDSTSKKPAASSLYLYAIASVNENQEPISFQGIEEQPIDLVPYKDIMLVVSNLPKKKVRPERKNVAVHHAVLNHLMKHNTSMLPIRFGMIADNRKEVQRLLTINYDMLQTKLKMMAGRVEMGVSLSWDVPNIFEYLLNRHSQLRETRDKLLADPAHKPSRDEKIEIGALFSQILDEEREAYTDTILSLLSPVCCDVVKSAYRNDTEIMNIFCLISAARRADFEEKIIEASTILDDNFVIKYTGPWPAHNFSKLNLSLE